ncbi:MAG: GNAT family N-acetyltransferase [Bacteroidia bacterium]|nr:GNAT family N-acetyltransferase [Bacteroidia bacterium]
MKLERTLAVLELMKESDFHFQGIKYLFKSDLLALADPLHDFKLKPASEMILADFQSLYFACQQGDPMVNLTSLTPAEFYENEKTEIGELWDEDLLHAVIIENHLIGVLNLRKDLNHQSKIYSGSINYIGILPPFRGKGLGKSLHLLGLHQLKQLGCESYVGSTDSRNEPMLKIFAQNGCQLFAEQHFFEP